MALKDKAKEAALQAKSSAQQIAQQGQQKLATVQKQRAETELLRALGTAVYNEHRNSGNHSGRCLRPRQTRRSPFCCR